MISAIRGKSRERKNDLIKQEAIERIEEKLNWNKDKLTFKDLREENRNYWEQIKSVTNDEIHWKVKDIENRVKENIDQQIIVKSSNQVSQVAPNFERSREREQKKVNYNKSVVSAQSWLDKAYPMSWGLLSERRNQIREVEITEKNLWGYLDLSEFINLEWLYCEKNRLTQLILPINNNLQTLVIQDNLLTNIDFSALNAKNLSFLDLTNNNFSSRDLSFFAKLRQLKELHLGNRDKEKIDQGTYNRWFGSLKPLQSLIKLEVLDISNTDINSGLEYLPNSIKIIYCSNQERPDSQVKKIADQLKGYYTEKGYYDLASWRKDIFSSTMNFSSLKKELEREKEKSNKLAEENQSLSEVNKYFENSLIEKEREAKSLNESLKLEKEKSNNFEKQLKEEKTLNESLQNYVREAKIEIPPKK